MKIQISIHYEKQGLGEILSSYAKAEDPGGGGAFHQKGCFLCFPPATRHDEGFISTARAINSRSSGDESFQSFSPRRDFFGTGKNPVYNRMY